MDSRATQQGNRVLNVKEFNVKCLLVLENLTESTRYGKYTLDPPVKPVYEWPLGKVRCIVEIGDIFGGRMNMWWIAKQMFRCKMMKNH